MKDTKYPYRCKAIGISSWIPLSKPVNPDYKFQLLMARPSRAKYNDAKFPKFGQPGIPRFGEIYRIEKNPHYVKSGSSEQLNTIWDRAARIRAKQKHAADADLRARVRAAPFQLNRGVGERKVKS